VENDFFFFLPQSEAFFSPQEFRSLIFAVYLVLRRDNYCRFFFPLCWFLPSIAIRSPPVVFFVVFHSPPPPPRNPRGFLRNVAYEVFLASLMDRPPFDFPPGTGPGSSSELRDVGRNRFTAVSAHSSPPPFNLYSSFPFSLDVFFLFTNPALLFSNRIRLSLIRIFLVLAAVSILGSLPCPRDPSFISLSSVTLCLREAPPLVSPLRGGNPSVWVRHGVGPRFLFSLVRDLVNLSLP